MPFNAPYPPYDPTDTAGFSYDTVIRRWPIIITSIIDELHNACHYLVLESQSLPVPTSANESSSDSPASSANAEARAILDEKVKEGNEIVGKISKLKYEMARDREMDEIVEDGEPNREVYNEELRKLKEDGRGSWFKAPWLFAECYLYRLLRSYFVVTKHWNQYDPFRLSKIKTFKHSGASILKIATSMHELSQNKEKLLSDPSGLEILFTEMTQMCLWGNATDLSLLTHMTEEDIRNLQTVEKDAQAARSKFILKDDLPQVWEHVKSLKDARVDFVLDNAGFELFTDMVFADFLVTYTPHVSSVVFHPKLIPWFVSDVLPTDFNETLSLLSDPTTFLSTTDSSASASAPSQQQQQHLHELVSRWKTYIADGTFKLSVPLDTPLGGKGGGGADTPSSSDSNGSRLAEFWTSPYPYWDLQERDPVLTKYLQQSGLVIFKGDLNYRKLTGDIKWPEWTPFNDSIGPLAGAFPLLSLRTNKADVAVGVPREVVEQLDKGDESKTWRVDGKYALISFVPSSPS